MLTLLELPLTVIFMAPLASISNHNVEFAGMVTVLLVPSDKEYGELLDPVVAA